MALNDCELLFLTDLEGVRIRSILDRGFISEFQTSPHLHVHSCFELFAVIEGELTIELSDGTSLCVHAGEFSLVAPMVYHLSTSNAVKKLAICFSCDRNPKQQGESAVLAQLPSLLSALQTATVYPNGEALCRIFEELREEMTQTHPASHTYIQTLLTQFYICLFRILSSAQEQKKEQVGAQENEQALRRLQIEEYFIKHFNEPIVEDDLAQYLNLSRRQVSRILQQIYQMSFRQLLIDIRLHRAEWLLLTTDLSIEKIAEMVGYTSISGFYTAFYQQFHQSAGQYRNEFQAQKSPRT